MRLTLKDTVQVSVLTVIAFVVGMAISMAAGALGAIGMYMANALAALVVGPLFVIMARRVKARGAAALFWIVYGLLYSLMGYWIMIPICLVSAILAEIIVGDYKSTFKIAIGFFVAMLIVALHPIILIKGLGPETILDFVTGMTKEQAAYMASFYTTKALSIALGCNIVLTFIGGQFGVFINNKFFEKRNEQGIL